VPLTKKLLPDDEERFRRSRHRPSVVAFLVCSGTYGDRRSPISQIGGDRGEICRRHTAVSIRRNKPSSKIIEDSAKAKTEITKVVSKEEDSAAEVKGATTTEVAYTEDLSVVVAAGCVEVS